MDQLLIGTEIHQNTILNIVPIKASESIKAITQISDLNHPLF